LYLAQLSYKTFFDIFYTMAGGIHPSIEVQASWPKSNYVNPETRPDTILILAYIFGPLTMLMLLVRLWVRIFHQRCPGWDDWLMLAATVSHSSELIQPVC